MKVKIGLRIIVISLFLVVNLGSVFILNNLFSKKQKEVSEAFQNIQSPEALSDLQFKTERDSVSVTEESIDITSYIQIYLDELMAGIDPAMLDNARLTDGVIIISSESNRDIFFTIMKNLVKNHKCYYEHKFKNKYKEGDD